MPSNHLILCHPLVLLPSIFPSIRVFSNDPVLCIGGQSIGASASALVLPMNIQDWFPLGWTGWISLQSKGLSGVFSSTIIRRHQFFGALRSLRFSSQLYVTIGKPIVFTIQAFVGRVVSLLFNILSRFVIAFLPRSKRLLISWLQSPSTVILEPKKRKSDTASTFPPSICYEVMRPDWLVVCELPDFQAGFIFLLFFSFFFWFLFIIYFNWRLITLQYCIGLPYINMNPPWVYTCSPSWTPLPSPSPYHPSGS